MPKTVDTQKFFFAGREYPQEPCTHFSEDANNTGTGSLGHCIHMKIIILEG